MATRFQCTLPTMQQVVVGLRLADHQIAVNIVVLVAVNMMNLRILWQSLAKRSLSNQNMPTDDPAVYFDDPILTWCTLARCPAG